jgi:hypothetical protein
MKVDQGSSFQKLLAGKVGTKEKELPKASEKQASVPQNSIQKAVETNADAASAISRVALATKSDTKENKEISAKNREEIESTVRAASESTVEDVSNLADQLASQIRSNPEEALRAQANQDTEKVHQLLQ